MALPNSAPPTEQAANFDAHVARMQDQLGGRVVALQSVSFIHYMALSGDYTVLGCEAGQALINAQLFYALTRGASKQYGRLIFGNVSVYNRWGYKTVGCGDLRLQPLPGLAFA